MRKRRKPPSQQVGRIRTREEVIRALEVQLDFIESSCVGYDRGNKWEALRLATATCTIVEDASGYPSILTQLGIRETLKFISTGIPAHKTFPIWDSALAGVMSHGTHATYQPIFRILHYFPERVRQVEFREWWEVERIFDDGEGGAALTRKRLARVMRNNEGGSHFDAMLYDPSYIQFVHGNKTRYDAKGLLGWVDEAGELKTEWSKPEPVPDREFATMRQIAWELLETIKAHVEVQKRIGSEGSSAP